MVLAMGTSPTARVRSASRVLAASRCSSWLSIQMPAVTVPSRQRRDPTGEQPPEFRSALRRCSVDQLRTMGSRGSSMASGARPMPGRNPGLVSPARPSTRPSGAVTARSRSVTRWPRRTAWTRAASPVAMAGRAARLLQLGLDLALAGTGDRLPAVGGGNGDRQHHDDDEEQRESGP